MGYERRVQRFNGEGWLLISISCNESCMEDNIKDRNHASTFTLRGACQRIRQMVNYPLSTSAKVSANYTQRYPPAPSANTAVPSQAPLGQIAINSLVSPVREAPSALLSSVNQGKMRSTAPRKSQLKSGYSQGSKTDAYGSFGPVLHVSGRDIGLRSPEDTLTISTPYHDMGPAGACARSPQPHLESKLAAA